MSDATTDFGAIRLAANHRVRRRLVPALALWLALGAALAPAQEMTVRNDTLGDVGEATIVAGFAAGEQAASWLTSPCDGRIVALQVLWLSSSPGALPTIGNALHVYNGGAFPSPGVELALVEGPQLTPGGVNEYRFFDEEMLFPISIPVSNGQTFILSLEFDEDSTLAGGSVVRDTGCQASRNAILAQGLGWQSACALGVAGDFVIRAVVDCSDQPVTVAFGSGTLMVNENDGFAQLQVDLSEPAPAGGVTVQYAATGGSADGGGLDYSLLGSGTLTIAESASSGLVALSLTDDALRELNETIILGLSNPTNAQLGAPATATVTIADNDPSGPPPPAFPSPADQGAGVLVGANLDWGDSAGANSYDVFLWRAADPRPGSPNATATTSDFDPPADLEFETLYRWQVTATGTGGSSQSPTWSFTTEAAPVANLVNFLQASSTVDENVGVVSLQVNLSLPAPVGGATVQYAVSGGSAMGGGVDYTLLGNGTLTFNQGASSALIGLIVNDDAVGEPAETIAITLANPSVDLTLGATTTHTVTINESDGGASDPVAGFAAASSAGLESAGTVGFAVNLSAPAGAAGASVQYAVTGGTATGGGTDFTLLGTGTLDFAMGVSTGMAQLSIVDDAADEMDETVVVTLSNPVNAVLGANTTHTFTIQDNDDPAGLVASFFMATSNADETAGLAQLEVRLGQPAPAGGVTLQYAATGGTATLGRDYTLLGTGTLTFNQGSNSATIVVAITDDQLDEPDETAVVTIADPTNGATLGAQTTHALTIVDEDVGPPPPTTPSPEDMATNISPIAPLDWTDSGGAKFYDLRLWKTSETEPTEPTAGKLTQSFYQPPAPLEPNTAYSWRVNPVQFDGETEGPVWQFVTGSAVTVSLGVMAR